MDIYRYSGLLPYAYEQYEGRDDRTLQIRTFDRPFPIRKIVSPLYINYASFDSFPKPTNYRAFFVVRDPRDLVVSHYFSSRYSHIENPGVLEERAQLANLSDREGLIVHMRYMAERGIFDALHSWAIQGDVNPNVKLFRFEELIGKDQVRWMTKLLEHCDIRIPQNDLRKILDRLSFAQLSGGRKVGEEDKRHKYRSGKPGDWKKYFDDTVMKAFEDAAEDLIGALGYNTT
jgi:hypothetical protein